MSRFSNEMKQNQDDLINPPPFSPLTTFSTPKDNMNYQNDFTPSSPSSSFSSISPILLLVIVILAVIFFISGLLHLLVRFLLKKSPPSIYNSNQYPEMAGSHSLQRQLQHLFKLHDSGLDQSFLEALPVFCYKDIIMGSKEPFDCAVCLCEFSDKDRLRLLPICSHAFHINCIDTWLLSNSTCPLCRASLLGSSNSENPRFDFHEIPETENGFLNHGQSLFSGNHQKRVAMDESGCERKLLSVRLGKFKKLIDEEEKDEEEREEKGETSNQNLDERRCFSMGTYQYIVGDSELHVASLNKIDLKIVREKVNPENFPGKKISGRSKGESFSVSKIWLWSKKSSNDIHMEVPNYLNLRSHDSENPIVSEV